ncbi:MAG: DUF397 domain-containing protein [Pseudonocardiaceae bacterium]
MTTPTRKPRIAAGGWFKSSWSGPAGECVEVNFDHPDGLVRIRDTKDQGAGPTISVTGKQWTTLLDELAGTVAAGSNGAVTVRTSTSVGPSAAPRTPGTS